MDGIGKIRSDCLLLMTGYLNRIKRPLDSERKKKGPPSYHEDLALLLILLSFPALDLRMVNILYSVYNGNATESGTRTYFTKHFLNAKSKRYVFSGTAYRLLAAVEQEKFEGRNVYSITAEGVRAIGAMRRFLTEGGGANAEILRGLPETTPEEMEKLRLTNRETARSAHSLSRQWVMCVLLSLSGRAFLCEGGMLSPRAYNDDILQECSMDPAFGRASFREAEKRGVCERIPDVAMNYFGTGGMTRSPVLFEVDCNTERAGRIYEKVKSELSYLKEGSDAGLFCRPSVILVQFNGEKGKEKPGKGSETEGDEKRYREILSNRSRYNYLLGALAVIESVSVRADAVTALKRIRTFSSDSERQYAEDALFVLETGLERFGIPVTRETIREVHRRLSQESDLSSLAMRERQNDLRACGRMKAVWKADKRSADHGIRSAALSGAGICACGRDRLSKALRLLFPLEYSFRETARVMAVLRNAGDVRLEATAVYASAPLYRDRARYFLSMRNVVRMRSEDGKTERIFCFEDLSHDLGAVYRLRAYVTMPPSLSKNTVAVFLIGDDERLADGRPLREYNYWEDPRGHSFQAAFDSAYGKEADSVPMENGIRSDFVFLHASEFLCEQKDASGTEGYSFFVRFGERVIKRTVADKPEATTALSYLSKVPELEGYFPVAGNYRDYSDILKEKAES